MGRKMGRNGRVGVCDQDLCEENKSTFNKSGERKENLGTVVGGLASETPGQ